LKQRDASRIAAVYDPACYIGVLRILANHASPARPIPRRLSVEAGSGASVNLTSINWPFGPLIKFIMVIGPLSPKPSASLLHCSVVESLILMTLTLWK